MRVQARGCGRWPPSRRDPLVEGSGQAERTDVECSPLILVGSEAVGQCGQRRVQVHGQVVVRPRRPAVVGRPADREHGAADRQRIQRPGRLAQTPPRELPDRLLPRLITLSCAEGQRRVADQPRSKLLLTACAAIRDGAGISFTGFLAPCSFRRSRPRNRSRMITFAIRQPSRTT